MRPRSAPALHLLHALLLSPLTLLPLPCAAQETQPASDSALSPTPATPHLDELASIYSAIPERMRWRLTSVSLDSAALELTNATRREARDQLSKELLQLQPLIERALVLSTHDLEPFPPPRWSSPEDPDAHLGHPLAHIQNIARLLLADASRAFDAKDPTAALRRIAATARFARSLLSESSYNARDGGLSLLTHASRKLSAMVAADPALMKRADPAALQVAVDAYAGINLEDPGSVITSWESSARKTLAYCREHFTGADGPEKYAAYLGQIGADDTRFAAMMHFENLHQGFPAQAPALQQLFPRLLATKEHAPYAAAMTPTQISAALNDAEASIAPIATALRTEDLQALTRALQTATEDQTQLARVVVGDALLTLEFAIATRRAITDATHTLHTLKPE